MPAPGVVQQESTRRLGHLLRDAAGDAFEVGVQVRRPWGAVDATITPPGGLADLVLYACGVDRTAEGA